MADILNRLEYCPVTAIFELFPKLSPSEQVKVNLKLLDYVYPKRSAINYYPLNEERPIFDMF